MGELIAIMDGNKAAGVIVWWRLVGGLNLVALETAWDEQGLDRRWLPSEPTPVVALGRAVAELRNGQTLVRSLPGRQGGWVVKAERVVQDADGEKDLDYTTELKAHLDDVGRPHVSPAWHQHADKVRERFAHYSSTLIQADVSPWLCRLMARINAVSLRDTGGVYFVPPFAIPEWEKITAALRAASAHVISNVPAMKSDEAISAISDAVGQEAEQALDAILREFEKAGEPDADVKLGKRALENRAEATKKVEAKVAAYEAILGQKLEQLHERAETLRAMLTAAALKAADGDEAGSTVGGNLGALADL